MAKGRVPRIVDEIAERIIQYSDHIFDYEDLKLERGEANEIAELMIVDRITEEIGYSIDGAVMYGYLQKVREYGRVGN